MLCVTQNLGGALLTFLNVEGEGVLLFLDKPTGFVAQVAGHVPLIMGGLVCCVVTMTMCVYFVHQPCNVYLCKKTLRKP